MEKSPQWIICFVLIQLFLLGNAHPDFISIDCGASSGYPDPQTGISYQTDTGFVETGTNSMVALDSRYDIDFLSFGRQLQTLRSFPEGKRNCYTLKPKAGKNNNYLIRAFFAYGNYDNKNQSTTFDLYLNVDFWYTVHFDDDTDGYQFSEIIHTPTSGTIQVCLVNTGQGIPFISTLELRPLTNFIYNITPFPSQSLLVFDARTDVGSIKLTSSLFKRFKDDIYDRVWRVDTIFEDKGWKKFNSSSEDIDVGSINGSYELPKEVLMSATKSLNFSSSLYLNYDTVWTTPTERSFRYYVIFHFVEIEQLPTEQKRVIDVTVNDQKINPEPIALEYLKPVAVSNVTDGDGIRFSISATSESGAPPILNALETYKIISPLTCPTDQTDADAILHIKTKYKIHKVDWQGDPCVPAKFLWEGLRCRYGINNTNARIISLNLSATKLRGQIAASFSQLTELESLDLSGNDLSGMIPDFLAKLPKLTILNLSGNKLTGSIPNALKENSELEMSLDDNPGLCLRDPCKKHEFRIPLIAAVSAFTVVILISLGIWIFKMKKLKVISTKQDASEQRNGGFSYSDVLEITDNLQNLIGEGGFGKVYLGTLKNCTQVAVKLLSHSSMQGHREFRSEVELLVVTHHRNLVSLIGYCEESGVRALIYEYMANGNLHHHLSSKQGCELKWKDRLQIALDAAYGLDYLHNGCKPAIVHRDLKASNILLDNNMKAKIADFGLCRAFANDIDTHVSTRPAGTIGYIDPQFRNSWNLTKGSDIYSFGIILLELLTGKPAAERQPDNTFILLLEWFAPKLGSKDDIKSIIDPRLKEQYNVDSALKFVEVAKSCTEPLAVQRPDISQVVVELRECLEMEIRMEGTSLNSSTDMSASVQSDSTFSAPSAR